MLTCYWSLQYKCLFPIHRDYYLNAKAMQDQLDWTLLEMVWALDMTSMNLKSSLMKRFKGEKIIDEQLMRFQIEKGIIIR